MKIDAFCAKVTVVVGKRFLLKVEQTDWLVEIKIDVHFYQTQ